MSVLDWLFIGFLALGVSLGVFSLWLIGTSLRTQQKIRRLKKRKPKLKKNKKKWSYHLHQLKKKKKKQRIRGVLLSLLTIGSVCLGIYARYYQLTNLTVEDNEIIVQSYFLVDELNNELTSIKEGADASKTKDKMHDMTGLLVSYSSRLPSPGLSKDGQRMLRRYYNKVKELGLNIDSQRIDQLEQNNTLDKLLSDIKKIQGEQKKVFQMFELNEAALQQKMK